MKDISIGVIGTGAHTQENLLPALLNTEGLKLGVIQSRDQSKAKALASRFGIEQARESDNPLSILEETQCDAFVVSSTPTVHEQFLLEALKLHKPVFVEKPPCTSLETLLDIHKLLKTSDPSVVQFGFNFRHASFYQQIKDMNERNPMRSMRIASYSSKPVNPMWTYKTILESAMYAVHIHAIEMLCYTLGRLQDFSQCTTWIDDTTFITTIMASFENSRSGTLILSNASNRFEYEVECIDIHKNVIRVTDFNRTEAFGPDFTAANNSLSAKSRIIYDASFLQGGYERTGYQTQFAHFRDAIHANTLDMRSIESCVDTYKIIEGVCNE